MPKSNPTESRLIDGIRYNNTRFGATQALALGARCVAIFGEAGFRALVLATESGESILRTVARAPAAIVMFARGLHSDPELPRDLCEHLKSDRAGGRVHPEFDEYFAGEFPHLFEVLKFVLEHNFAGFTLGRESSGGLTSQSTDADDRSSSATPRGGRSR